jgi:hypothetical protein
MSWEARVSSSIRHRFRDLADEIEGIACDMGDGYESELLLYVVRRWREMADEDGLKQISRSWDWNDVLDRC